MHSINPNLNQFRSTFTLFELKLTHSRSSQQRLLFYANVVSYARTRTRMEFRSTFARAHVLATHRQPEKRRGAHPFAILQPAPEHQSWCALVAAVEMGKWMPLSVSQTLRFGSVEEGCSLCCSDAL